MKKINSIYLYFLLFAPFFVNGQTVTTLVSTNVGDDLHFGTNGYLYSSHYGGTYIRKINPINGEVDSILNTSTPTIGAIELDKNLTIYTCSWDNGWFGKFNEGEDAITFLATGLNGPAGISSDTSGNVYVATNQAHQIVKITPDGQQQSYYNGSPLFWPTGITSDPEGNLFVANMFTGEIIKINTDQQAEILTELPSDGNNDPDIAYLTWSKNRLFVCHIRDHVIYQINPLTGEKEIIAGTGQPGHDDGPALSATFESPTGIASSTSGDTLFITDGESPHQRLRMIVFETVNSTQEKNAQELSIRRLYPQPSQNKLQVEFNVSVTMDLFIQIIDMAGKIWLENSKGKYMPGTHNTSFDISNIPRGNYALVIKSQNTSISQPFSKK